MSHVFNDIVNQAIADHKYRLLGRPVLNNIEPQKDGGWIIKLDLPLYPEVKLEGYKKLIETPNETKKSKSKTEAKEEKVEDLESKKLDAIYDTLLNKVKIDVSPLLIEEEVNYSLERLTTQAKTLNLTLESYLKAVNKTLVEVKAEYSKKAEESIKLDVILLEIANQEKLDTTNEELLELAKVTNTPKEQLGQLKSVMNRRKTIDFLLKI
jgi:FKBP-type peptidyl-prolyl cis-trans isomerase (trigger factor)